MKISVLGLGYVGVVAAACLAEEGHEVVGVDVSDLKVKLVSEGKSPIVEKDIDELVRANAARSLRATSDVREAILSTEMSLICVGTPSEPNGNLDLSFLVRVCEQIGSTLKEKSSRHVVVVRSTVLPGTMRNIVIPILEQHSGKKAGVGFGVCNNPEFLREGTAVWDYRNPPKTVIGSSDEESSKLVRSLYEHLDAPLLTVSLDIGEMVKYVDNVWHATKVAFANEVGAMCKELAIDSHEVMNIFCLDTKLNLSPYYLKPGYAFGGSCLPKDLRALNHKAKQLDLSLPLMDSVLKSNEVHIQRAVNLVANCAGKKVGVLGFSFKAGTDDLRESPIVEMVERMLGKGFQFKLFDRNVRASTLLGANKSYIANHLPHLATLMTDDPKVLIDWADTIVIGNNADEFSEILKTTRASQKVVDLVRLKSTYEGKADYTGICW